MNDDIIIVASQGTNEITVGDNSKLMVVKKGEERSLTVKSDTEPRWVWIATEYIEAAKKILSGQKFEEWGEWDSKNADKVIDKYGIFKQYVIGKGVSTKIGQDDIILKGTIYYFEAFREVPTLERGHYVATIDKPQILSAYFAQSKDAYKYPGEAGTSQVYTYKSSLKLYVLSHLIPDYTKPYHNFALFEVTIWDRENDSEITTEPLQFYQKTINGKFTVNTITELDFIIDEKWRDNANHTKGEKEYYAKIKTTIYANEDAVKGSVDENGYLISANENPSNSGILKFTNKFNAVSPNNEEVTVTFTSEDEAASKYEYWWFFEGRDVNRGIHNASNYKKTVLDEYLTKDGQVLEDQQVTFKVRYETMDVILDQYEAKKNNMFAVVGDIEYVSMETEPCKYSKITIEHKSRMEPYVLFDEYAKTNRVIDHTDLVFGIVAGDTKEKITIKAEGLEIQSYQASGEKPPVCLGINTRRRIRNGKVKTKKVKHKKEEEFLHNTIEDVFNMQQAYILFPENRMVTTGDTNIDAGDKTIDISSQGIDYKPLKNGIELEIEYLYNKNYDNRILNFLAQDATFLKGGAMSIIEKAWLIKYLLKVVKNENVFQSYYIPIGTCRYPNQLAKIRVYPDMKWAINFNYNIKDPLYYENTNGMLDYYNKSQSKGEQFPILSDDPSGNIKKKRDAAIKKKISAELSGELNLNLTDFKLFVECEYSGGKKEIIGDTFAEKFRGMLSPIVWVKDKMDSVLGVTDAAIESERLKKVAKPGLLKRLNELPMSFTLHAPAVGFGVGIGYGATQGYKVGYELEGKIIANPIIAADVTLDVLALGSKFKPWGAIIDALDIAAFLLEFCSGGKVEAEYKIEVKLTAEIILVGEKKAENSYAPANIKYNFASKKFESVDIGLTGRLRLDITFEFGIKLKGIVKAAKGIVPEEKDKEMKEIAGAGIAAGATSEVSLTLSKNFGKSNDFTTDFYFSGVTVWIKFTFGRKKNKKPSTYDIVPALDKTFDVLKNKGTYE
ncbi:hypothetical protein [Aequorivita capsosiphonis]|uniref:hypothetical protein n=1 Tax=Aequorivita capsosiphonis TaxID=487317 RepID=UPI0004282393|nr:hypothetical protein [Aequorivita capsosiphonis]